MRLALAALCGLSLCVSAAPPPVSFSREIRPILSDKCFQCHGPDEETRAAGLRLDTREGALTKIKPGNPAASRLFVRISHENKARRMPPPVSGMTLTDREIDTVKRWIEQGAPWESHWAFAAPKRAAEPEVHDAKWARNPIDRFVLAKLESQNLRPSPEADRITLLRRVTFDLTGLPPTPAEIDAFVKDHSADAYEKVVDRLLTSSRYGERMAGTWLDLARYADTHGYHIDSHRDMWPWRDWLIGAFNRNLPWNEFVIEQLAGDLLPNATLDQKIATGFNRNHMINYEGGAIPEEYLNEYLVDRVDTTATVFMGLTMGCSRCHDHKFDPIRQREYYSMYAFFNSVPEKGLDGRIGNADPILQMPTPDQKKLQDALEAAIKPRTKTLNDAYVDSLIAEWEKSPALPEDPRAGLVLQSRPSATYNGQMEASLGDAALPSDYWLAFRVRSSGLSAMPVLGFGDRFSLVSDESIPTGIQMRGAHLFFTAGGKTWQTRDRVFGNRDANLVFHPEAGGLKAWIDGKPLDLMPVAGAPGKTTALAKLTVLRGFKGVLEDVRVYDRALSPIEMKHLVEVEPARAILEIASDKRSKDQKQKLRDYYLENHSPELERRFYTELVDLRLRLKKLNEQIPSVMVMKELEKPRETHVLGRGDYRNLGDKVEPGVPSMLPPLPKDAPKNRLTLAKWLTAPDHPLTSRVAVNRFWSMYFGTGIVKTVEDFGSQGELPSHPQLLDWLATEFVRTGWDVKAMQRLIVTSATYRQSSKSTPEINEHDPENRLLSHGPRFRLPAEMIRDSALSVSGLLNAKQGGPSVYPYSPKNLWEDIAYGDTFTAQIYPEIQPSGLYRRSMYTFWKRTAPPATLNVFDAPDREKCTARRALTNTPLQALALMNDPTFVEAARMLGQRMFLEGGTTDAARIGYGFRLVTGRTPEQREASALRRLLVNERDTYLTKPELASKLLTVGMTKSDARIKPPELAAWSAVASAMLNLDEAITKE